MSRMVRDSQISGLRERHWFARVMLRDLEAGISAGRAMGELLALRGAVVFHLYSALVGLAREVARGQGIAGQVEHLLGLSAIGREFDELQAPEWQVIAEALANREDPLYWLHQEMLASCAASGLARRPSGPVEDNPLAVSLEDPNRPLAEGDLKRLHAATGRVQTVIEEASSLMQEW